jgi:hypothetical protein
MLVSKIKRVILCVLLVERYEMIIDNTQNEQHKIAQVAHSTVLFFWPLLYFNCSVGWDSSVGTEARYGLDSPGTEFQWGRDFLHLSGLALGPTQSPIQWILCISQGKVAGSVALTTHAHLMARLKSVELYFYSLSGVTWTVLGWTSYSYCTRQTQRQNCTYTDFFFIPSIEFHGVITTA